MKKKDRLPKIVANTIISGIIGALIGIVLTDVINNISNSIQSISVGAMLFIILFTLAIMACVFFRIDNHDEFRTEIMQNMANPLIKINTEVISDFATSLVKRSKYIRVVGTAKQDILDDEDSRSASKRYLATLEKKLSKDYGSEMGFQYYRVVPKKCSASFKEHFDKCKENCDLHRKNVFAVVEANDDWDFYISYQIFDQTDMLIIVDNPTQKDINKDDNALCYWTQDKETIEVFTKRFDSAWARVKK